MIVTFLVRILQEWKFGQSNWNSDEVTIAINRVDRLAQMLHLNNKPAQLRCLDLVGYATADTGQSDKKRLDFCFLYRLPPFAKGISEPVTLRSALDLSEKQRPTLAE
jgi:hypothetical protein